MKKVVIIGGGPAGMMACYQSQINGNDTILIEKNEKLGKKLYITGKGRCNLTNDTVPMEFINNVVSNPKFMLSIINMFSPEKTMSFFEENGLKLKVERGNRVFPLSDKSSDVTKCLENLLIKNKAKICLKETVLAIKPVDNKIYSVKTDKREIECDSVIIATGGVSYSSTGSTGDGYVFAKSVGHNVIDAKSALVGIELKDDFYIGVQGLSLKNIKLSAEYNGKTLFSQIGEMLFTHFGISGPLVLTVSSIINRKEYYNTKLILDLKPGLDTTQLENRILRDFTEFNSRNLGNLLDKLLPKSLIPVILARANIGFTRKPSDITKQERDRLINAIKHFEMKIKALRPIEEAIITAGGVNVKEINPKTMESKLIQGLYFAGEVIDVDAFTGGFNIQIALSTGFVAGSNA